jgi:hypothetical protein
MTADTRKIITIAQQRLTRVRASSTNRTVGNSMEVVT